MVPAERPSKTYGSGLASLRQVGGSSTYASLGDNARLPGGS